jgi:hypothetical protein
MWQLLIGGRLPKITAGDIDRAVQVLDEFVKRHTMLIPVHVHEAYAGLRGALLTWKIELAAEERKNV